MAGIDEKGVEILTIEALQQENKTLRKQTRILERRLAESEQMISMANDTSKNMSQMSAYMEKEILQREKYLNMLLDNCNDFFILLNENLEITYCSRNFAELMRQSGYQELRGQNYRDLAGCFAGEHHRENALERLKKLRLGEIAQEAVEEIDFRMDGKPGKYTIFAAPMYDENHAFNGILVCYSDVTDLVAARETAEESVKAKSAFLARMSHEIRTPMNAIIGLSKLALREELSSKVRSYCSDVNSAANNLLGIINDILDFSKIESGKMEIAAAEYQFASLANDVISIIRMRLGESPVRFVTDIAENIPGRLIGDEIRIRQVLLNLLSNAVKYTREGQISFSMGVDIGEGGQITLRAVVADTGIGIKAEDMGKLFGNFNRLDLEKNKNVEGTGLGLAITLNLCRVMGGDITVKSEYGKGSVFTALIPQQAEDLTPFSATIDVDTGTKQEAAEVKFTAPAARVLIVDDISMNLKVAEGLISPYEIQTDICLSGAEALNLVRRHGYDIIFMDHMMPGMDGVEAAAFIRAMEGERFKTVPIIALTANAMSGMREMFLEKGFNDYISKPIEIGKLDEVIARWIPAEKRIKSGMGIRRETFSGQTEIVIPGADTRKGIAMTGGTEAGYRKVLAQFYKDARERLPLLRHPPGPDTLPLFVTQAHAIKSAAGTIGAAEVSAEAAALEAAGKAGDTRTIGETLPAFRKHLTELIEGIEKALEEKDREEKDPASIPNKNPDGFRPALLSLRAALEAKNIKKADKLFEEIEKIPLDTETRERINAVSDKALLGEYEGAVETITMLLSAKEP